MTKVESKNKEWGFYGTMQRNYGLSDFEVSELFDYAAKLLVTRFDYSDLDEPRTLLDDRWGRHYADFLSFHGASAGMNLPSNKAISHFKKIIKKTFKKF